MRVLAPVLASAVLVAGCTSSTSGSGSQSTPVRTTAAPSSPGSSSAAPTSSPPSSSPPPTSLVPVPRSGPLNGFLVADLTFVGNQGWALGTVGCTQQSGRCTALAHSTDNGRTWRSMKAPKVNVAIPGLDGGDCTAPCVEHVRYATPAVGYLLGGRDAGALLMTTDGGNHWRRQPGNADALESLDGNVIRVSDKGGCPPGCAYVAQVAAIGGSSWRTVPLTGSVTKTSGVTV